jgi:hypothetical protein
MSTRTRLALALALLSVAVALPARAQDASVDLTLERQTPFATANEPVIEVAVTATNTGDSSLEDLEVGFVLGEPARTRDAEQAAMDPASEITFGAGETRPQEGTLEPGRSRTFEIAIDLLAFGVDPGESLIYPMGLDLRSGDTVVAELRTPVLFFFQTPPLAPLTFAWTIELAPPVTFGPDGSIADDTIEREIVPGGRIAAQVEMLRELAEDGTAANVVLSPILVSTLQRMAGGYRVGDRQVPAGEGGSTRAQELLAGLRKSLAAPNLRVSAYPFAAPQLPAMLRSGLARDLDLQIDRGRDLVGSVLGITPTRSAARAPFGQLDANAIQRLAADGATTVLVEADTVDRPAQPLDFAPLPTAALDGPGGGDPIALVLPDPGAQALLSSGLAGTDPVLAAQQALGALAAIWQEQKVPPEGIVRGAAVSLTEDLALPARFWEAFGRRVSTAPFLDPVTAEELVSRIPPVGTTELLTPSSAFFSDPYVESIRQERRRIDALRSAVPSEPSLPDDLAEDLLYAEAGAYVGNEYAGRAWTDAVQAATERVFARAAPAPNQDFTLASGNTTIPLRIPGSEGPALAVRIELQSSAQLRFPDGAVRETTITGEDRIVTFQVEATGAGQVPVRVLVRAPNGLVLSETNLVVRSTAFNRVAIGITVVAALALIALWLRRLMARRRTT